MRKLILFMMTSLDGFIEGPDHDLSWHNVDAEFNEFAVQQLQESGGLIFGRKTYELMEGYWPTAEATDHDDAIVAEQMNSLPKIVISRSLEKVEEKENWKNVRLIKENVAQELKLIKAQEGKNLLVLGSNNLCVTLLQEGLLDEVRIMVNPVVIGKGTVLFAGLQVKKKFSVTNTSVFKNGNVLVYYKPLQ